MKTSGFYLLADQTGQRYIFYKGSKGEKIIDNFSKLPYTAQSLYEDICNEFSDFLWEDERSDNFLTVYEYDDNNVLTGMNVAWLELGEEGFSKMQFTKIAAVKILQEELYCEFYTQRMNEKEKILFDEFKIHLIKQCDNQNVTMHVFNSVE